MKIADLTPRMIGKHIRIETPKMRIEGRLNGYDTSTEEVGMFGYERGPRKIVGMTVHLDEHELQLGGYEDCRIVKGTA